MLKKLKSLLKNQKGLTLVELLAVVVILGIVSSIATVSIGNVIQNSREDAVRADAIQILNAAELHVSQGGDDKDIDRETLGDSLGREGAFEGVTPSWTVSRNSNGELAFTGSANAGSQLMTFNTATVSDINNAERGHHVIPDDGIQVGEIN